MARMGVIGIIIQGDKEIALTVQNILHTFADIIVARQGVPNKENGINVISVIVNGTNEQISALTGKLGKLDNIAVKSAITSVEV